MKSLLAALILILVYNADLNAQGCCSGGGNNPLAGTGPTGVLAKGKLDVTVNNIFSNSNRFYTGTKIVDPYFDKTNSNYSLVSFEYGLNDRLTLSTNIGYYGFRTIYEHHEVGSDFQETITGSGFGDLIFLPRYKVFSTERVGRTTELNLGVGFKIPLSQPNDSNFVGNAFFVNTSQGEPFLDSIEIWQLSPPMVQVSTGSNDLMASFFFLHSLNRKYTLLASGLYINRGWNYLGIKYGDYSALGIFLGRSIGKSFNASLQIRGEIIGGISTMSEIDYMSKYNIDKSSTGSKSISISPLLSYHHKGFRLFTILNMPIYQNFNGTQVEMPKQLNVGVAYSFYPVKNDRVSEKTVDFALLSDTSNNADYLDTTFTVYGVCNMCKERIESTVLKLAGVASANYDVGLQKLSVNYNASIEIDTIKQALAKVGHDTDTHRATKSAYKRLHKCCKYERPSL